MELGENLSHLTDEERAMLTLNYGTSLALNNQVKKSKRYIRDALKRLETIYGKDSLNLVPVLESLGDASAIEGNEGAVRKYYQRALKITRKHYGDNSVEYARKAIEIAYRAKQLQQYEYLLDALEVGYLALRESLGPEHIETGQAAYELGSACRIVCPKLAKQGFSGAIQAFSAEQNIQQFVEMAIRSHYGLAEYYFRNNEPELGEQQLAAAAQLFPDDYSSEPIPIFLASPSYRVGESLVGYGALMEIQFTVDKEGKVLNPVIIEKYGAVRKNRLEKTALRTVEKFRYMPGYKNGEPVETESVPFVFSFGGADEPGVQPQAWYAF